MPTCPICSLELEAPGRQDGITTVYSCKRCGSYGLDAFVTATLGRVGLDDPTRVVLSHSLRKMQSRGLPIVTSDLWKDIREHGSLPKPGEQAANLILWLGENADASDASVRVDCEELQAIIGCRRPDSVFYVANHLAQRGFVSFNRSDNTKATPPLDFQMTFDGWDEFEKLRKNTGESRTAFMAMKFGDPELDRIVNQVFRPAVAATGFELRILSDASPAGLIDDRLRVEIRRSRFLIADLTHRNPGAYWEAGFAEGLGKHVIYTCKADVFKDVAHFDTNHHLTVMWHDGADSEPVAEALKATIRATLPDEARLDD